MTRTVREPASRGGAERPRVVVSVLVADRAVGGFGLGVAAEIFGYDRRHLGLPAFDFALVAERPGTVRTDTGIPVTVEHGLERLARSDVVVIASWEVPHEPPAPALLAALVDAHARGALLVSQCTGAFLLARAGLLEDMRATTHWRSAGELAASYPGVHVDPSVLYVDSGRIITSAGTAAGIDALLHLVRREWGATAANALAREMVVPPHRDGGQAQYIDAPVARCEDDRLGAVLEWAEAHLADDLGVEVLARRALMSPRSFARSFKAVTGTTPHAWLLGRRLAAAEVLLEGSDAPVEEIARLVGFGTAAGLREQFTRRRGVSPRTYRQTFRAGLAASAAATEPASRSGWSGPGAATAQLDRDRAGARRVRGEQPLVEPGLHQSA